MDTKSLFSDTKKVRIYTVSEITKDIRFLLEDTFGAVWIEGEISNFKRHHQSGHIYFSLKDEFSILPCAFFRRNNLELKFELQDGMRVLCFGRISVYGKKGIYQFYVEKIEPKGAGALQIAFEQLKEKLKKEGLFDESRKRPIPFLPQQIGVVTSPTGAAIRDVLSVARRRFSNIEIILNPVRVQGEGASSEIADAIVLFNRLKNVDVILVCRGGGSLEDLWPFNEENVARAIFHSEIPVISAVGHDVDYTISDFVADLRAPTPSAAAELLIPKKEELITLLKGFATRLKSALFSKVENLDEKLNTIIKSYIFRKPLNIILQYEQEIDTTLERLRLIEENILRSKSEHLNTIIAKLDALNPLAILSRGYSITMRKKDGVVVKDASVLKKKEFIKTVLAKGEIISKVEEVRKKNLWQR